MEAVVASAAFPAYPAQFQTEIYKRLRRQAPRAAVFRNALAVAEAIERRFQRKGPSMLLTAPLLQRELDLNYNEVGEALRLLEQCEAIDRHADRRNRSVKLIWPAPDALLWFESDNEDGDPGPGDPAAQPAPSLGENVVALPTRARSVAVETPERLRA